MTKPPHVEITREHLRATGIPTYLQGVLNRFELTHWDDLNGRCVCVLGTVLPSTRLSALQEAAATHGAEIISHEHHALILTQQAAARSAGQPNPGLDAMASRAGCPLSYSPPGRLAARYVLIPRELWNNWDQPEAYWWRRGVDAALTTSRGA